MIYFRDTDYSHRNGNFYLPHEYLDEKEKIILAILLSYFFSYEFLKNNLKNNSRSHYHSHRCRDYLWR